MFHCQVAYHLFKNVINDLLHVLFYLLINLIDFSIISFPNHRQIHKTLLFFYQCFMVILYKVSPLNLIRYLLFFHFNFFLLPIWMNYCFFNELILFATYFQHTFVMFFIYFLNQPQYIIDDIFAFFK